MWLAGLKWMFLIIGTSIGAGYASGRELWQFFGDESVLAIFLFTCIFTICCYIIMKISYEKKTTHFSPVLQALVGKKASYFYDIVIIVYLFTTTVVMLAGGGATLEIFNVSYQMGIALFCFILVLVFAWDLKGILSINAYIVPCLIIGLLGVLIWFLAKSDEFIVSDMNLQSNWPAAFTFTSLNILPLVAVLSVVGKEMKHVGEVWIASIGSGVILGVISFIYNESLIKVASEINVYEIPLYAILKDFPVIIYIIMSILLWVAIFTTATSGLLGMITRLQTTIKLPLWGLAIVLVLLMIPFTKFGFGPLIALLYPLYGIINLYLLVAILLYPMTNHYNWD